MQRKARTVMAVAMTAILFIGSIRSERGLTRYAPFLLGALVKRPQTTLHTASQEP